MSSYRLRKTGAEREGKIERIESFLEAAKF
jgi:hypothetical protein